MPKYEIKTTPSGTAELWFGGEKKTTGTIDYVTDMANRKVYGGGESMADQQKRVSNQGKAGYDVFGNPVMSSTAERNNVSALGNEIKNTYDNTALTDTSNENIKFLKDRMDQLDKRREAEIAQIKADYEQAAKAQEGRQGKEYAGRATNLVTSGGGFLGTTQSQQGVLQNLRETHEAEKGALMSKRDAAIQAAQSAYEDKDFALAQSLLKESKDYENELYKRQKDFADQELALAREARAAKEFDFGITDKKVEAYSTMNDEQYANLTPSQINEVEKNYYPGYINQLRQAKKNEVSTVISGLASKYPSAGITSSDTFDTAQEKIRKSDEYKLDMKKAEIDLANTISLINQRNTEITTSMTNFIDVMQTAINAGATPEQAAREAAAVSESTGVQVDQKTLNNWTEQAKKLKKTEVSETTQEKTPIEKDIETSLKSYGNDMMGRDMTRDYLRKKGYTQEEINSSSVGSVIENVGTKVKEVGSFFSNLFGQ